MNIYSIFSAILMALLLFYSQLETVYARFPFGIQSIVNEDPEKIGGHEQYDTDFKWDMGMMPQARFLNRAPESSIPDEYRVSNRYHQIIEGPEKFDRGEYNVDRFIMPRAYDFKNSETHNAYFPETYGSNNRDKIIQRSYHNALIRELEDLDNENYNYGDEETSEENSEANDSHDDDNVGSSNSYENSEEGDEDRVETSKRRTQGLLGSYYGNNGKSSENDDVDMSSNGRRNFDTKNQEPENDYNNDESSDSGYEDNEDWSTTNDDSEEEPRLEEPRMFAVVEAFDDDYDVDMGELSSSRRGNAIQI